MLSATGTPSQTPPWQRSAVVQALPSSHGVLLGAAVPAQVPLAQVSWLVHEFWSSHAAPSSSAALPAQVPSWQASAAVHWLPSSHGVPFAWRPSGGQAASAPVQVSAASHWPAAAPQALPAAAKAAAGPALLTPCQLSSTSPGAAPGRHTAAAFPAA